MSKNRWITEVRVKWDGKCPNVLKLMLLWPGSSPHFHSQRIKRRFENFLIHFLIIGKVWDKDTFEVMRGRARKKWIQSKLFNYILFHFLFKGYIFIFSSLAMFYWNNLFSILFNVSDPLSDVSVFIAKNINWCPSQRCSVLHHILMDSTKDPCHKEELAR